MSAPIKFQKSYSILVTPESAKQAGFTIKKPFYLHFAKPSVDSVRDLNFVKTILSMIQEYELARKADKDTKPISLEIVRTLKSNGVRLK